jgi:hypothetical protein
VRWNTGDLFHRRRPLALVVDHEQALLRDAANGWNITEPFIGVDIDGDPAKRVRVRRRSAHAIADEDVDRNPRRASSDSI